MSVPRFFAGLLDDAAIFPPGDVPMPAALAAHADHRKSWFADLVGPFVCSDTRLGELFEALAEAPALPEPLPLSLLVSGGAGAVGELAGLARDRRVVVAAVEAPLRVPDDAAVLAEQVRRTFGDDVPAYGELPRGEPLPPLLDALAAAGARAKLRTGGVTAEAFPDVPEVARFVAGCAQRELPFKCTAGLHHAVRATDPETGFEHHGFLNVLQAARVADAGGELEAIAEVLDEPDGGLLADRLRQVADQPRPWFASFGTCSIVEPLDDLVRYLLVSPI